MLSTCLAVHDTTAGLLSCFKCPRESGVVAVLLPGMMCTLLLASRPLLTGNPYSTGPRAGRALLQKGFADGSNTVIDLDVCACVVCVRHVSVCACAFVCACVCVECVCVCVCLHSVGRVLLLRG